MKTNPPFTRSMACQIALALVAMRYIAGCQAPAKPDPVASAPATADSSAQPAIRPMQPSWAFDAPEYSRPKTEADPAVRQNAQDPLHFFINRRLIYIRRPAHPVAEQAAQVALYSTQDNSGTWQPIGTFGAGQT